MAKKRRQLGGRAPKPAASGRRGALHSRPQQLAGHPASKKAKRADPQTSASLSSPTAQRHRLGQSGKQPPRNNTNNSNNNNNASSLFFHPADRILLVGEGDLSFAASLVAHHGCGRGGGSGVGTLRATVPEASRAELEAKHTPEIVGANVSVVEAAPAASVQFGVDATKMGPYLAGRVRRRKGQRKAEEEDGQEGGGKAQRVGGMDRIVFNFPHVGGKSTDVNRQVRHNQALLVGFFQRALLSLAPVHTRRRVESLPGYSDDDDDDGTGGASDSDSDSSSELTVTPSVVVTLFESAPYTLWNVRDLARHCGLRVARSGAFDAAAFPGYRHARTLGLVRRRRSGGGKAARDKGDDDDDVGEGGGSGSGAEDDDKDDKDDEDDEDEGEGELGDGDADEEEDRGRGSWRGEERPARTYIFVRKEDDYVEPAQEYAARTGQGRRKKRRRGDSDSEGES